MTNQNKAKYRLDYKAPEYTITEVYLDFTLDATLTIVKTTSQIKRLADSVVDLMLDGEGFTLNSVKINGEICTDYEITESHLIISKTYLASLPTEFTLEIENQFDPSANTALEGLYQSGDALCTQCEAEGFRKITYYLDRPDVSAKYTTRIVGSRKLYPYLLSNGNKIAAGELDGDRHYAIWEDPFPKPSYLFALVAGDFDKLADTFVTKSGRSIELLLFVDKGNLDKADFAMQSLKASMKWDETRFDLEYDLDIYMIVAVDFFNMGAMENKGLNIFNSKFVLAKTDTATDVDYQNIEAVIGHEYFHNWTGNRVTCRDWFQLSLKEGLTVFRDQEFSSDMGSRSLKRIDDVRMLRTVQFAEDAGPTAHPIRPDKVIEMNNFYTVTVYEKGAEIIRMLHTLLGETHFQVGIKKYLTQHDGSAATCKDFLDAMQLAANEAKLGLDLTQFELWYSQAGTPEVKVSDTFDISTGIYKVTIEQRIPPTAEQTTKAAMMIPLGIDFYDSYGKALAVQPINATVNAYHKHTGILLLTEAHAVFEFSGLNSKPVVSFLRDFSAPVKLNYAYSDEDLMLLMRSAENAFVKWDASQIIMAKVIKNLVSELTENKVVNIDPTIIDLYRSILLADTIDLGLVMQLLTLPTVAEVVQWYETSDPVIIDAALLSIKSQLGLSLQDELLALINKYKLTDYRLNAEDMAQRGFVNLALSYLAHGVVLSQTPQGQAILKSDTESDEIAPVTQAWLDDFIKYHYNAGNMTDRMAALSIATLLNLPSKQALLDDFEMRYKDDSLVMDKWLNLQAQSRETNALETVKALMKHSAFSMQNPNRIRSLIGAFINHNHKGFHAENGSGYKFLEEILTELNYKNPQVASRLIEPLLIFKRYKVKNAEMIKAVLQRLSQLDDLSNDLSEKINKALA